MVETFYTLNKKLMQIPKETLIKIKVNESWYNGQREQNIMITNSNNKTGKRYFQGREVIFDNSIPFGNTEAVTTVE